MKKVSRNNLYREIDKLFLWLIQLPDTDADEDKSLREIQKHLVRLSNLKSEEYTQEAPEQPEQPQQQEPQKPLTDMQRKIMSGEISIGGQE